MLKIELAEALARAEVALGRTDAAMDAYRQLLTAAGSRGFLGEQLYNLAEGASALGRTDDAINALRTSIAEFPRSRKAPDAVELLEKLGGMRAEDRYYAGLIRYYFWNFRGARADFDAYLAAHPNGDRALEARYYRGLSSPARDTTTQLLDLADAAPDDDIAPLALYEAGKAQEELADYATRRADLRPPRRHVPDPRRRPERRVPPWARATDAGQSRRRPCRLGRIAGPLARTPAARSGALLEQQSPVRRWRCFQCAREAGAGRLRSPGRLPRDPSAGHPRPAPVRFRLRSQPG